MRTSASFASGWVEPFSSLPVFPFLSSNMLYLLSPSPWHFNGLHYVTQTLLCKHNCTVQTNNDNHIMRASHTFWLLSSKLSNQLALSGFEETVGKHLWVTTVSRSRLPRKQESAWAHVMPRPESSLRSALPRWRWVQTCFCFRPPYRKTKRLPCLIIR